MDIDEFYDADPRRRASAEIELGRDWHDEQGVRYELSWVQDTGELYLMREPAPGGWATPFGGIHATHLRDVDEREVEAMTVAVLATIASQGEMEEALAGWQQAMPRSDGLQWLADRLRARGMPATPASPSVATP